MTKDEALKMALEALENLLNQYYADTTTRNDLDSAQAAINAIREALAQPEQERTGNCPLEDCDGGPKTHGCWAHHCEWKAQPEQSQVEETLRYEIDALETKLAECRAQSQQEPVAHSVVAGALFDFMGWLTSRKERIVLSSADNASPAVEAITEFAKMRNLSLDDAKVQDWNTAPPQPEPVIDKSAATRIATSLGWEPKRKPLTDEEIKPLCDANHLIFGAYTVDFIRAIEAAHGIKE